MIEKEKVCKCQLCDEEKLCGFVGNNNGTPFYACSDCMKEELKKAFKMEYMKEYRVMICGSRTFKDYEMMKRTIIHELNTRDITDREYDIIIVQGEANGADKLGKRFAIENGYMIEQYPALWTDLTKEPCKIKINKFGHKYNCLAGLNRNKDMVEVSDLVIMFHDGVSKGTLDDLRLCKKYNKDFKYILF